MGDGMMMMAMMMMAMMMMAMDMVCLALFFARNELTALGRVDGFRSLLPT